MKKGLAIIAAAIVLAGVAIIAKAYYSLRQVPIATPAQTDTVLIAVKGSLGEAIFGNSKLQPGPMNEGTGLDSLFAHTAPSPGGGFISEYQKDPEKFRRYAQLFDTALNAKRIGRVVQENRLVYKLPLASSVLSLNDAERLDAWGHPYCIIPFRQGVAVVSGGPQAQTFGCGKPQTHTRELSSATKEIFQTGSGEVVVLVGVARAR